MQKFRVIHWSQIHSFYIEELKKADSCRVVVWVDSEIRM
ncbi:hypothetical protein LEP1GSC081_3542 [Leptospira kirschneri str. H1]|nr:hypothetical protein LEP1GSC081_3542 [Leptospira kirschneri str. H1]